MTIDDLMTPDPATLAPEDTVRDAIDLLRSLDVRHVPIVRKGQLIGMLSDRDLREATLPTLHAFDDPDGARKVYEKPLADLMRSDVISVQPSADAADVIDLMIDYKVGAVPVVDDGALVGIVSYIDVLRVCRDLI